MPKNLASALPSFTMLASMLSLIESSRASKSYPPVIVTLKPSLPNVTDASCSVSMEPATASLMAPNKPRTVGKPNFPQPSAAAAHCSKYSTVAVCTIFILSDTSWKMPRSESGMFEVSPATSNPNSRPATFAIALMMYCLNSVTSKSMFTCISSSGTLLLKTLRSSRDIANLGTASPRSARASISSAASASNSRVAENFPVGGPIVVDARAP